MVDYYKILQVDRSANDDDLKKAYRKLAVKWNPNNSKEADAKFKQISDAYCVLSDPQKRAVYDQYGEEGLKGQVPPGGFSGGMDGGGPTGSRFVPRSADDIFSEFFGFTSPRSPGAGGFSGGMDGSGPTGSRFVPRSADDTFSEFFGFGRPFGGTGDMGGRSRSGRSGSHRNVFGDDIFDSLRNAGPGGEGGSGGTARKAASIERMLPCSLDDLYKGTTKKMKISREVMDSSGRPTTMEEILTIEIKRGWKKGTKITFPEKGNEQRGVIPADLVFIIDEKPHSTFKRDGNDLIFTQKISVVEALTGYTAQVTTLDGRNLRIPINSIISPTYEELVEGEGMPIPRESGKKGNLRITFNVKFPRKLTSEQKTVIKGSLTSS